MPDTAKGALSHRAGGVIESQVCHCAGHYRGVRLHSGFKRLEVSCISVEVVFPVFHEIVSDKLFRGRDFGALSMAQDRAIESRLLDHLFQCYRITLRATRTGGQPLPDEMKFRGRDVADRDAAHAEISEDAP